MTGRLNMAESSGTDDGGTAGASEQQQQGASRQVTPLETVGAGGVALALGALAGFSSHYIGRDGHIREALSLC